MKKKKEEKTDGITLVALIITIFVLLILAGITLTNVLGDNGIIKSAKDDKNKTEEKIENKQNELKELTELLKKEIVNANVKITAKLLTYNSSLGNVQTIFRIVGEYEGKTIYENMKKIEIDSSGEHEFTIQAEGVKGTKITITPIYVSPSYEISTPQQNLEYIAENQELKELEIVYRYNGEM